MIPSIFRLASYTAYGSGQICILLISLILSRRILYVILKALAIFISVTVLLATLSVAQAKTFTVKLIDVQVAF